MRRAGLVVAAVFCLLRTLSAADKPWAAAATPHFTVISDSNEKTAREIASQLEQVRAAIHTFWPWTQADLDKPVVALVVNGEDRMKSLAPQYWEQKGGLHPGSVTANGLDRYYIALRSDVKADDRAGSVNPYLSAYWSYTTIVLNHGLRRELPLWFNRGVANFMSNTIVRESSLQIGRPVPRYTQHLRSGERPTLPELLAADRRSPWFTDEAKLQGFDAMAWAFVHYLMLADDGAHRPQLDKFTTLLSQGQTPAAAADSAFGNIDAMKSPLAVHYSRPLVEFMNVPADVSIKPDTFQLRGVPPAETAALQAGLHLAMRRPVDARNAMAEAKKADAMNAVVLEQEGILLENERKPDEARAAYTQAIALQSTNAYVHYRWAVLNWTPQADAATKSRVDQAVERAITLNDRYAPAYVFRVTVKMQTGHPDDALPLALKAVAVDPGVAPPRVALTRVLLALGRRDEAQTQAATALELARNDTERQNAQQLLDASKRKVE